MVYSAKGTNKTKTGAGGNGWPKKGTFVTQNSEKCPFLYG